MNTFRSAVEAYQDCPRYRFNAYHHSGVGLVPVQRSIPLVTGTALHRGVEHLLNRVRIGQEPDADTAVALAVEEYVKEVEGKGFRNLAEGNQQWFTFHEQKALVEALIRAWFLRELPQLVKRFKVIGVERELEPIQLTSSVMWQARVDAELQEIETGEFYTYNLKSCKSWSERMESTHKSNLQGVTEIWAVEEDYRRQHKLALSVMESVKTLDACGRYPSKNLKAIEDWFKKTTPEPRMIMGVRSCYLVKGKVNKPNYETEPNALEFTYNPLIRGYKKITPNGIEYAHSWFYPNPNTKSGKGTLGAGWEPFFVWQSDIGVKNWISFLDGGQVQPECGDVIKQHVITPIEYYRDQKEIEVAMEEVKSQEGLLARVLDDIGTDFENMAVFPHYRKQCEFHFGQPCEYKELCWKPEIAEDPIGSGLYEIRIPHHVYEKEVEG